MYPGGKGVTMSNTIIITLIICITLIILYAISAWEKVQSRKDVMKKVKRFTDAFGDISPKKQEPKKDDAEEPLKFGDD